ncbi:MAG: FxsA family protein [Pirellulaceae bacterium]|nr:FxsA family protein [Pirellulaceae bacterium]
MLARLLLLFIVVPLLELTFLLLLAELTRWWVSLLLVVVTGLAGTLLVQTQGLRTYRRIQQDLARGQMPAAALLDGLFILMAGALLLTPGMLTDLLGISFLIPVCRTWYRQAAGRWIQAHFHVVVSDPGGVPHDLDPSQVVDAAGRQVADRQMPEDRGEGGG